MVSFIRVDILVFLVMPYVSNCIKAILDIPPETLLSPVIEAGISLQDSNTRINSIWEIETSYDFIIIGSGSSGSVLANRLSENPEWKILLLEVGKPESLFGKVPLYAPLLQWSSYNWNYKMEPQSNACLAMVDRRCAWPRGRALGGSSVINYMIYSRGSKYDYDRWAKHVDEPSFKYENLLPYFKKSEKATFKLPDRDYHGTDGYLDVSNIYRSEITDAFLQAGTEIGENLVDYNGKRQLGFSFMQATVKNGRRHSVASAFLQPIKDRKNLHILTESRATKIIFEGNIATGVYYYHRGRQYKVIANNEVILSAGAFNSPQLLMLSGIGPKDHLNELGIPMLRNLPVGLNLQDHISYIGLVFLMNKTVETTTRNLINPNQFLRWYKTGKGPLSSLGGIEAIAFIKTNVSKEIEDNPDIELIFVGGGGHHTDYGLFNRRFIRMRDDFYYRAYKDIEGIPAWSIFPMLLHPKSVGYLKLKSKNPFHKPLLYGNYFTDLSNEDKAVLIASIRYTIELSKTKAFQKYASTLNPIPVPGCEQYSLNSDEYWNCALERQTVSLHHQIGTCKMGAANDTGAVVDSYFKVVGVNRLRVVDSSVIPFSISAHTNAPAIMLGEKAADVIKLTYGYK